MECPECGNKRFFYNEVSVMAKQLIDVKEGVRHGKIIHVESNMIDNFFESVHCYKCDVKIMENYL